jgi:hypothetical protein
VKKIGLQFIPAQHVSARVSSSQRASIPKCIVVTWL